MRSACQRRRPGGQDGFVAGAESLIFGVLVFVIGTLVVVNAWAVVDAKFATSAAAREAVRAAVQSPPGTDLEERAEQAARRTLEGYGREPAGAAVTALGATKLERCVEVGFRVEVNLPAVALVGDLALGELTVGSRHFELVEPYRAGLPLGDDPEDGVSCVF